MRLNSMEASHLRAGRTHSVAHAPARSDFDHHDGSAAGSRPTADRSRKSALGDVVWFPPGEKHWHGATLTTAMTHIAVQEFLNGKNVDWMEKVSDAQYRR